MKSLHFTIGSEVNFERTFIDLTIDRRGEPKHGASVTGPDDQIMSLGIPDLNVLVGEDPLVLIMPLGEEETDGPLSKLGKIPIDEAGVLLGEFDLPAEGKIVTNGHGCTSDNSSGGVNMESLRTTNPLNNTQRRYSVYALPLPSVLCKQPPK
jgi:hypothetical protein